KKIRMIIMDNITSINDTKLPLFSIFPLLLDTKNVRDSNADTCESKDEFDVLEEMFEQLITTHGEKSQTADIEELTDLNEPLESEVDKAGTDLTVFIMSSNYKDVRMSPINTRSGGGIIANTNNTAIINGNDGLWDEG
ncbi:7640_t:CDS:2, partial [Dentiscutata erythropus]